MYEVKTNIEKNCLYMTLSGFLSDEEARAAADAVIAAADELQPGFTIINKIEDFKPLSPNGSKEIARAQAVMIERGIGRTIRVVGQAVIGKMQFERVSAENEVKADLVATMEDAEALLDE